MKKPIYVVLMALVAYAGVGIGGTIWLIRPRIDRKAALLQEKQQHEATIAKRPSLEASLVEIKNSKTLYDTELEQYRAVKMPLISFTAGDLYALQGLMFEQGEDLGPIVLNALEATDNTPEGFSIPDAGTKAPSPVEPLPIPSAPFNVSFTGTFDSMLKFLRGLPAAPRIIALGDSLTITRASDEESLRITIPIQEFTFAKGTEGKFTATAPAAAMPAVGEAGAAGGGFTGGAGGGPNAD